MQWRLSRIWYSCRMRMNFEHCQQTTTCRPMTIVMLTRESVFEVDGDLWFQSGILRSRYKIRVSLVLRKCPLQSVFFADGGYYVRLCRQLCIKLTFLVLTEYLSCSRSTREETAHVSCCSCLVTLSSWEIQLLVSLSCKNMISRTFSSIKWRE